METLNVLLERRSIRKYRAVPVPDEILEEIVRAGLYAPSGLNLQPWYFAVARTAESMQLVRASMAVVALRFSPVLQQRFREHPEVIEETQNFLVTLGGAPACILVFAHKKDQGARDNVLESTAAAIQNMQLAAWNRGVGACWIAAPKYVDCSGLFEAAFGAGHGEFIAAVTLGYPAEDPKPHKRREGRWTFL